MRALVPALVTRARTTLTELGDLILPRRCGACRRPGELICPPCRARLEPGRSRVIAGVPVHAALAYRGPAAALVRAVKSGGETELLRPLSALLAPLLRAEIGAALDAGDADIAVTTIPLTARSARRRGQDLVATLVRGTGVRPIPTLAWTTPPTTLEGLSAEARRRARAGALRARGTPPRRLILVDDIVTTGATLADAIRVLTGEGAHIRAVLALAAAEMQTPERGAPHSLGEPPGERA